MQEYKIVKQVLLDFMDDEDIFYDEEENSFSTPLCIIGEFDGTWQLSFDLAVISEGRDVILASQLIVELMNHQIMINIDSAYYPIYDKDDKYADLLWESDIYKKVISEQKDYEVAKEELIKEMLSGKVEDKEVESNVVEMKKENSNLN